MGNARLTRVIVEELERRIGHSETMQDHSDPIIADYHKRQIEECGHRLHLHRMALDAHEKRKSLVLKFIAVGAVLLILLGIMFISPNLNLFAVKEQAKVYSEDISEIFGESGSYEFTVKENGTLDFVKLSGLISGNGDVKIYLDDLLVVDSSKIKEKKSVLTGFAVGDEGSSSDSSTPTDSASGSDSAPAESAPSEPGADTSTPAEQTPADVLIEQPTEQTPTEEPITVPLEEQPSQSSPDSNDSSSENTQEGASQNTSISQETNPPASENITEQEQQLVLKEFSSVCEETCELAELNLTKESYTLRIELTDARLKLTGLEYGLIPFILLENITLPAENITLQENVTTNETNVLITTSMVGRIIVGQPVKWKKTIEMDSPTDIVVELPAMAENISVVDVTDRGLEGESGAPITGFAVTASESGSNGPGLLTRFWNFLRGLFRFTGFAIDNSGSEEPYVAVQIANESGTDYEILYETPAPEAFEESTPRGKKITISAADELNYTDVLASTELPREVSAGSIRLYHLVNGSREQVDYVAQDLNGNGMIDYIEWNVPHLSNQTYEIIIITKAEHLNANRTVIADVYDYVKAQDNNWTTIPEGDYLRVVFEKNLTNRNDITIYARAKGNNNRIEVYEKDKNETLAIFDNVKKESEYKIYLTNLTGSQDTFDLKVFSNSGIEFDYVVDPSLSTFNGSFFDGFESGSFTTNGWSNITTSPWTVSTDTPYAGTRDARSSGAKSTESLLYLNISTAGYSNITASFYYNAPSYLSNGYNISWWNGTRWKNIVFTNQQSGYAFSTTNLTAEASDRTNLTFRFSCWPGNAARYCYLDNFNVTGTAIGSATNPVVSLSYPPAGYGDSLNRYVNLTFNATVTDDSAIANCTFWHNATGTWHQNQTQIVTGKNNVTSFNLTGLTQTSFTWNIRCRDNSNNIGWGTNRTVTLNWQSTPKVIVIHPTGETYAVNFSVLVSANVSSPVGVNYSIAQITLPNGTIRNLTLGANLSAIDDNFNTNTMGTNWLNESISDPSQGCVANINSAVAGKAFTRIGSNGGAYTDTYCSIISKKLLYGDFDINVSFEMLASSGDDYALNLELLGAQTANSPRRITLALANWNAYPLEYEVFADDGSFSDYVLTRPTSDTSGKFRIKRVGNVFTFYTWNSTSSSWLQESVSKSDFAMDHELYASLEAEVAAPKWGSINVSWDDFSVSGNNYSSARFNETSAIGTYNIRLFAMSSLGEVNSSETTYFRIGTVNTAPSVPWILSPATGELVYEPRNVTWSLVTDTEGDALKFNITLLNPDLSLNSTIASNYGNSSTVNYIWNTTQYADGNYSIRVIVFESATAEHYAASSTVGNFSLHNYPPDVVLSSPTDSYYNSTSQYVNLTFNATVTDAFAIVNCSLWHNANGTWYRNQTQAVTGKNNVTSFNLTRLTNVSFTWNIGCRDNLNYLGWGTNRTVTLEFGVSDSVNPEVSTIQPTTANQSMVINYNATATDNVGVSSCDLYIDGVLNGSMTLGALGTNIANMTVNMTLPGVYEFLANCSDSNGNYNDTSVTNVTIVDTAYPKIFNINLTAYGTYATINWVTNELANRSVRYGMTTALGSESSSAESGYDHQISLTSLSISTLYYYNVTSCDPSGKCNTTGTFNFTTSNVISPLINSVNATPNPINQSQIINITANVTPGSYAVSSVWIQINDTNYSMTQSTTLLATNLSFFDGFESGSLATNNWTNSGTGTAWVIRSVNAYAGTYDIYGNPQGLKYLESNISTAGYGNITLSYYVQDWALDAGEYCGVGWYDGEQWIDLDSTIHDWGYKYMNFSLPSSANNNPNLRIRFKIAASASNEYCYVDNVNITGIAASIGSGIWNLSYNVTSLSGLVNYTVYANDSHGNLATPVVGNFTITNQAPQITSIERVSAIDLNEGPNSTSVIVNFTAYDVDGAGNLNDSSARINFTRAGEALRANASCAKIISWGNNANYSCNVKMYWFDGAGNWDITASVSDLTALTALNTSNFTVNALTGFVSSPSALAWSSITPGVANQTSSNDPIILNNTGNQDISVGNIRINATDLRGESNSLLALYASNFSVGIATGGSPSAECGATSLNKSLFVGVASAVLPRGNFTINDGSTGQEQLYFCLKVAGAELTSQAYSTSNQGAWTIKILVVGLSIAGAGGRKKRKKKEGLISRLLGVKAELKKRNLLEKAEVIEEAISEIREAPREEITNVTEIPVTIFSREVGALEVLCKYLKENAGMSYHEIAIVLKRDDRTVWTACQKANEKHKEQIEARKTEIYIPITLLGDRKRTVLEAVIVYLKEKGMRFNEIAGLVDRDQRNVWTVYSRAVKK